MDNKVTKKRLNDHLEYDWFKYVIILIVSIVLGYFIFSQINANRDYETVDIFVSTYATYENKYESKTMQAMQDEMDAKYGEHVIRQLSINAQDPLSNEYSTLFSTQGTISSDILIVGERMLKNVGLGYVPLTDELLTKYLLPDGVNIGDLEYYEHENETTKQKTRLGIRVDTFAKMGGKSGVFEFDYKQIESYKEKYKDVTDPELLPDTKFYMVLNPNSLSIGEYGKEGKVEHKQALYCVNTFIDFYRI